VSELSPEQRLVLANAVANAHLEGRNFPPRTWSSPPPTSPANSTARPTNSGSSTSFAAANPKPAPPSRAPATCRPPTPTSTLEHLRPGLRLVGIVSDRAVRVVAVLWHGREAPKAVDAPEDRHRTAQQIQKTPVIHAFRV
jgi:hypothetical protein